VTLFLRGTSLALTVALLSGCGVRMSRSAQQPAAASQAAGAQPAAAPESLSEHMQKVRHLSARPLTRQEAVETLETRDPVVAAELLLVSSEPTAERFRSLAEKYRERGVLDAAYRHFNRALALNPRDSAAYEGLARVWRDWGLPELAVGDAHRAVYYAPLSASARNTYGTIMQALGRNLAARVAYELAGRLDPEAAYAANNQCYLAFLDGRLDTAIDTCTRALAIDPTMTTARNNLALAFAASGRVDLARAHFLDAGDRASGLYNTGIVYLASGDDKSALAAFDEASRTRATFQLSRLRADQIRARLRTTTLHERLNGTAATSERSNGASEQ
jgi:tetratricopeptide (TPR) repeat protein